MQTNLFIESGAEFSPDRVYRYSLWRFWSKDSAYAAFVGLNPSTADEHKDDPTIRRCIRYAKDWGYSGVIMLNLFAYRSTDPKRLYTVDDPIGPDNDFHIRSASSKAQVTVAAWGNHGDYLDRAATVIHLLKAPQCLGVTKAGSPRHPLYLKKDLKPVPYINR
ncbi:MAG: DUF1643 domain-containing protein [Deltaproteobacteria bacterium]|nr:DUF1643 domain-containing protein [Deltaproteobacteria bacterium]